jgi:serine/threonine protein kinase
MAMAHVDAAEISRFLGGQLPPERAAQVEQHLAQCQTCAERLSEASQALTEMDASLAPLPQVGSSRSNSDRGTGRMRGGTGRPLGPGETVGRYLILEQVGEGGMGVVYAAWDPDLGRRVAIKLLRPDKPSSEGNTQGQARLLREAQAMARVSHPNVISVFDVGPLGEGVFVAMEFVDGGTLRRWIKDTKRPWREVLDAFLAAGRGLAAAHAAGLAHRDFKPDNVLLGKDGRVRVTDFGLARLTGEDASANVPQLPSGASLEDSLALGSQLTETGLVMGTPMYMAPEQRRGNVPDARSDQFSFCVALYWALFGDWPFDRQRSSLRGISPSPGSSRKGTDRQEQGTASPRPVDPVTGAFEPPRDSKVPAPIRRALMRGLSPEPEKRFASMDALLAQLEYRPRMARTVAAAATLALVLGAGGYAYESSRRQALVCTGAEQQLAGLWDEPAREQVKKALLATGKPEAADVASRVTRMLDGYTRDWVEASTEACRATRVRGEQTEALFSLRVMCLERRLKDVKAVTGLLASADAELLAKAADTVSLLPSLHGCADVATLGQVEPPPDSPQAREAIERISSQVAQAKALSDAGRFKQGLEVAEPAVKAASTLGYRPLEAEALLWQGWLQARAGDPKLGEQLLTRSVWSALASRGDEVMVSAASRLVYAIGVDQQRLDDASQWSELAKAALARMGGNEELESELFNNMGVMYARQGRNAEALAAYQRALQLADRALGPDHVRRSNILGNLGNLHRKEGQHEEALKVLGDALALRERLSGPQHPVAGSIHYTLAQTWLEQRDFAKARAHALRALDIHLASVGPEHPLVGSTYDLVGESHLEEKQYQPALEAYEKALAIKEKKLGKAHGSTSNSAAGAARCLLELGEPTRAYSLYEQILASEPEDADFRGEALLGMARALDAKGPRMKPRALALARKARAEYAQVSEKQVREEGLAEVDAWLAARSRKGSRVAQGR